MFLDLIRRRKPRLIEAAIALHQNGELPANTYVIDLGAVEDNAHAISAKAVSLGLTVIAMTKQMGRKESFRRAVMRGGIARSVAVDLECALATTSLSEAAAASAAFSTLNTVHQVGGSRDESSRSSPAFAARTINSIAGTKAGFAASDVVAVAEAWIRFRMAASWVSRLSRHCCSTPRAARSGQAFCFVGGLYIDPVFANYQVKAIGAPSINTA